jgi:hypothetical protein
MPKRKLSTKEKHKESVITTSLGKLFKHNTGDKTENERRKWLSIQIIRYAVQQISQINILANYFANLYALEKSDQPLPPAFTSESQTFWNWTQAFCSTFRGKIKLPTSEKNEEQKKIIEDLTKIYYKYIHNLWQGKLPERECLGHITSYESRKRVTNFKTMYMTTFFSRQRKVLRDQVQTLLPSENKASQYKVLSYCIRQINNNTASIEKETQDMPECVHTLIETHKRILNIENDIREEVIFERAEHFVPYFGYLWKYYKEKNDTSCEEYAKSDIRKRKVKWKLFPIIPQLQIQSNFIDINIDGLLNLVNLSETKSWLKHVQKIRKDDTIPAEWVKINWVTLTGREETKANPTQWYAIHKQEHLNNFYTNIHKSFSGLLSSDGQQAKIHIKKEILVVSKKKKKGTKDATVSRAMVEYWFVT